eukprot:TRINITY_DN4180_c0_g1_i1.p1 TRINITY_DN4180_c0_g1~~TRINITY_DN4180_c0_g1_i1.p1  ORF type:complete len:422 (-),score=133.24 TRINITY_DN4180_c0_g1_i1:19-1284(-)
MGNVPREFPRNSVASPGVSNYVAASFGAAAAPVIARDSLKRSSGVYQNSANDIIPFCDLEIKRKVGEGSFGCVYKARWRSSPVAVKEISQKSSFDDEQAILAFKKEANTMRNLRPHPNVILFLGICVPPDPICIVTEYLKNGSLFEFIKNPNNPLNLSQKVKLLLGVSQGMLHIQREGIIHRDLAARNILLGSNLEPKVSDFGMSRQVATPDQVGKTYNNVGPLKWMAPESILENLYSPKSDVWSFGVVCYEVIARAEPYYELNAVQAAYKVIHLGMRLSLPQSELLPTDLQILVASCFQTDPMLRPSFEQICSELDRIEKSLKSQRNPLARSSVNSLGSQATSHGGGESGGSNYNKTPNTPTTLLKNPPTSGIEQMRSPTLEEMVENENYQLTPSKPGSVDDEYRSPDLDADMEDVSTTN